eukprot:COSAG01_NODE_50398_length_363_cov_4.613636_2_plen_80_part_01
MGCHGCGGEEEEEEETESEYETGSEYESGSEYTDGSTEESTPAPAPAPAKKVGSAAKQYRVMANSKLRAGFAQTSADKGV